MPVSVISFHFLLPCFVLGTTGTLASSTASFQAPEATCLLHGADAEQQELCASLVSSLPAWNPPTVVRGQLRLSHPLPLKIICIATVGFIILFSIRLLFSSLLFFFFSPKKNFFMRANLVEDLETTRWWSQSWVCWQSLSTESAMRHAATVYINGDAPTKKHQAPQLHPCNSYSVYKPGKRMLCF